MKSYRQALKLTVNDKLSDMYAAYMQGNNEYRNAGVDIRDLSKVLGVIYEKDSNAVFADILKIMR